MKEQFCWLLICKVIMANSTATASSHPMSLPKLFQLSMVVQTSHLSPQRRPIPKSIEVSTQKSISYGGLQGVSDLKRGAIESMSRHQDRSFFTKEGGTQVMKLLWYWAMKWDKLVRYVLLCGITKVTCNKVPLMLRAFLWLRELPLWIVLRL